ncbi:MAG: PorT family protein [Saprospiraceae bacterium]|nr:PorT family protein [Saprospiraceae bacterium]MCF8252302.1 PorT family protein [Saprospiraceae bacterium]MCF8282100.1 PorT family protein [Bacteroidales bacterium]MCF8313944.1 PorT family protein [Saprospiraceae bacterium]MCF8442654.1 PorT family protein [Saprospiraceae bacterium]
MTRLFIFCVMLAFSSAVVAQDFNFGFKTGLNFSNIKGDLENTADAKESLDQNIGFQFGATFAWKITDLMGLRGEFMYSQKGTKRSFDGKSYYNFFTPNNDIIRTTGIRKEDLNVSNSYLELPILPYFRPHSRFEIYGGVSFAVLVNSTAFGNIKFSEIRDGSNIPTAPNSIDHELDYNYLSDKPRGATYANPAKTVSIQGDNVPYPQTAGAYFEFVENRGKLYNAFDLGVVGGVSIYLSKSLYVSGRINYGLKDVTKTKADVSLSSLDNGNFISRNDDDRNFSTQVSIGFSF